MTHHDSRPQGVEGTLAGSVITIVVGLLMIVWAGGVVGLDYLRGLHDWLAARAAARALPGDFDRVMFVFDGLACTILFVLGVALVQWGASMAQRQWREAAHRKAFPQAPWKWRLGWTETRLLPRANAGIPATLIAMAVSALMVIPASVALALDGALADLHVTGSLVLAGLLLAAILGIGVRHLRAVRWRRSLSLRTEPSPLGIGSEARFELHAEQADGSPLSTRLVCERIVTSAGEKRKVTREVLWESFQDHAAVRSGVPLRWTLRIPEPLPDSTPLPAYDSIEWRLEILPSATKPSADFHLPVFGARPAPEAAKVDNPVHRVKLSPKEIADSLRRQGIDTEWQGDKLRSVRSLAGRHKGTRRVLGAFSAILTLLAIAVSLLPGLWPIGLGIGVFAAGFWWLFSTMGKYGAHTVRLSAAGFDFERSAQTWKRSALAYVDVHPSMRINSRVYYSLFAVSDQAERELIVADVHALNLCESLREYLMVWSHPDAAWELER
jgi:hypothetical protein